MTTIKLKKMKKIILLASLVFSINAFAQLPSYVPTNGLVSWYSFTGNANDLSGNNNNGTVNGATLTTDRFGNANAAYIFNGTSDYIQLVLLTALNNQTKISVSFWMNSPLQSNETVFAHWSSTTVSGSIGLNIYPNQGGIGCDLLDGIGQSSVASIISTNTWNHIVLVYDGTQSNTNQRCAVYVNGLFQGYFGISSTPSSTGSQANMTVIGGQVGPVAPPYIWNYFTGKLDDIGIWTRALTTTGIDSLYNGGICFQTITVTDTLIINTNITGFNPVTFQNTIKVWPNPTNDHITIDNGNIANLTGYQLKITNSLGQQVFQSAITQQQFYVDLSTWTGNGIYFVHIINGQGATIDIKKIVLQ